MTCSRLRDGPVGRPKPGRHTGPYPGAPLDRALPPDTAPRLALARGVVAAKLLNAAQVLLDHIGDHPDIELNSAAAELRRMADSAAGITCAETLRGIEGSGARNYFQALQRAFRGDI